MNDLKQEMQRGLNALSLEVPEAVVKDVRKRVNDYVSTLETRVTHLETAIQKAMKGFWLRHSQAGKGGHVESYWAEKSSELPLAILSKELGSEFD